MKEVSPIGEKMFVEKFRKFFERLHCITTGSKKIAQLNNVAIYEKEIISGEKVNFYFFHGTAEEQEKFFPVEKEAYCTFRNSPSKITASFKDGTHDFICAFGYVLHIESLLESFRLSERSPVTVMWASVQICSHEIRHEMQLQCGLAIDKFRVSFSEIPVNCQQKFNWNDVRNELEFLYRGYFKKNHDAEYLSREYDAIVTSFACLIKWFRGGPHKTRLCRIAEIIKK